MRSDVGASSVSRSLVRLCAPGADPRWADSSTCHQPHYTGADGQTGSLFSRFQGQPPTPGAPAGHFYEHTTTYATRQEKKGSASKPIQTRQSDCRPIYLMLGLPAFDQSAAGDEPSSGPSPNTFPTLLGPGIALALTLTLRPSPPSGPKRQTP